MRGCFEHDRTNDIQRIHMKYIEIVRRYLLAAATIGAITLPGLSAATIVEIQTNQGNFEVNLYDNGTPQTVANFLSYVNGAAYDNSIIHRSVSNFVIQGGGFDNTFGSITSNAPVVNEPEFANVRGTIAMAKLAGDPDSATNQWFINLGNNTANLDAQNGGFTAFGEVVGDGMDVVDAIATLQRFSFANPARPEFQGSAFAELPLDNYTVTDLNNSVIPDNTQLVVVTGISITDPTVDSAGAAGITPVPTTATTTPPPTTGGGGGGGGGSIGLLSLLFLFAYRRRVAVR